MAIKLLEWLTRNGLRSFPLREDSAVTASTGFVLPADLLVDALISAPDGHEVCLGAVCLTPKIITVVLISEQTGETLATATAFPGVTPSYSGVHLVPAMDGVSGFVAFGSFMEIGFVESMPRYAGSHLFEGRPGLEAKCVVHTGTFPVESIKANRFTEILGSATLNVAGQLVGVVTEGTDTDGEPLTYLTLSIIDPSLFSPVCDPPTDVSLCAKPPIFYINEVTPDEDGNLELEFVGFNSVTVTDHSIRPLVLLAGSDICSPPELPNDEGQLPPLFSD